MLLWLAGSMASRRLWDACGDILLDGLLPVTIGDFGAVRIETKVGVATDVLILHVAM